MQLSHCGHVTRMLVHKSLHLSTHGNHQCSIIEGMFVIHTAPLGSHSALGDYASLLIHRFILTRLSNGGQEVHVIFDSPVKQLTPKLYEDKRRDSIVCRRFWWSHQRHSLECQQQVIFWTKQAPLRVDCVAHDSWISFYTSLPSYDVLLSFSKFLGLAVDVLTYWGTKRNKRYKNFLYDPCQA